MGMSLGMGLGLTKVRTSAAVAAPTFQSIVQALTNVAAFDFASSAYFATTGFRGWAYIKDAGTPANDYSNSPRSSGTASKITNTNSSLKIIRDSAGYLDFAPHNLALRSDDISNASWGKVATATAGSATLLNLPAVNDRIQQTLTASQVMGRTLIFSAVLSGTAGATMTLTIDEDGTETNQQITLTTTPTRYSVSRSIGETPTTVRVWIERNTGDTATSVTVANILAQVTYYLSTPGPFVQTAGAIAYTLPFEWDSAGALIGVRHEEARTNLCLRCCDLANAAWTLSNMTAARTATGPNNRANFATTLTATAGNATVLQAITSGSAARKTGCWIKRRTGSGTIEMTQDNGSTWAAVTVTSSWTLVEIATATLANPTVGLRIVTNGDAVDVAFFQHETIANIEAITSPIYTVGATVTRAVDNFAVAVASIPAVTTAATVYAKFKTLAQLRGAVRTALSFAATSTNSISVRTRTSSLDDVEGCVNSGGASTLTIAGGAISTANGNKVATAVASNDGQVVADGASLGTDSSTGVPSGAAPTHLVFGMDGTGTATALNGWLIEAMITPARMSQGDMFTLTT